MVFATRKIEIFWLKLKVLILFHSSYNLIINQYVTIIYNNVPPETYWHEEKGQCFLNVLLRKQLPISFLGMFIAL